MTARMTSNNAIAKYHNALGNWPKSGSGQRLVNRHVLSVVQLSRRAGISPEAAARDIDIAMRKHTRSPHPGEIDRAMTKVLGLPVKGVGMATIASTPPQPVALSTFRAYAAEGVEMGFSETDLRNPSPSRMPGTEGALRIGWEPGWVDAVVFLLALFHAQDWVFCAENERTPGVEGQSARRRDDWCAELERRGLADEPLPLFIIPNPIKAPTDWAMNGEGRPSPRVAGSIAEFRHVVLERDSNPLKNRRLAVGSQIAFLGGWGRRFGWNRVRAVVHTGNKSVHCAVVAPDGQEISRTRGWFSEFVRLGFDPSFDQPQQMCRLPGAWRRLTDKQLEESDRDADGTVPEANRWQQQRLLYINIKGVE